MPSSGNSLPLRLAALMTYATICRVAAVVSACVAVTVWVGWHAVFLAAVGAVLFVGCLVAATILTQTIREQRHLSAKKQAGRVYNDD